MFSSIREDTRPWSQLNPVGIHVLFLYITQQVASNSKAYDLYYRVSNLISAGRQNFLSLFVIFLNSEGKFQNITLNYAKNASFHILPNTFPTSNPPVRRL
jgi:hypothetical protein